MKWKMFIGVCLLWSATFTVAEASVRINEIAWMGTVVSHTNEWIELSNDSASSVDLSGWHIEATDGSPNIALSGSIAPNGYFLIERTSDDTVPDVAADLIAPFGNGFSNSGETLRLKNGDGTIIDTVVGGADWVNIGGDNSTKDTAQRTGNSWITGTATPRAANVSSGEVAGATVGTPQAGVNTSSAAAPTTSSTPPATPSVPLYPRKTITVLSGDDQRVFVGFPVKFSGRALGYYDESLTYATYRWNFGDGAIGEGTDVVHTYRFPGDYVATLDVVWANTKAVDRLTVVVSKPDVVITRHVSGALGFVEITNHMSREIDMAGWRLSVEGGTEFIFPPNTIILPAKSAIFPNEVTGIIALNGDVRLFDPNAAGSAPASDAPPAGEVKAASTTMPAQEQRIAKHAVAGTEKIPAKTVVAAPVHEENIQNLESTSTAAATVLWQRDAASVANSGDFSGNGTSAARSWFYVVLGIALVLVAGLVVLRSRIDVATVADEYAIIEDIIEGKDDAELVK